MLNYAMQLQELGLNYRTVFSVLKTHGIDPSILKQTAQVKDSFYQDIFCGLEPLQQIDLHVSDLHVQDLKDALHCINQHDEYMNALGFIDSMHFNKNESPEDILRQVIEEYELSNDGTVINFISGMLLAFALYYDFKEETRDNIVKTALKKLSFDPYVMYRILGSYPDEFGDINDESQEISITHDTENQTFLSGNLNYFDDPNINIDEICNNILKHREFLYHNSYMFDDDDYNYDDINNFFWYIQSQDDDSDLVNAKLNFISKFVCVVYRLSYTENFANYILK